MSQVISGEISREHIGGFVMSKVEQLDGFDFPAPKSTKVGAQPQPDPPSVHHAPHPTGLIEKWDPKAGVSPNGGDAAWGVDGVAEDVE